MSKKTAILGATTNPSRYAYFAAERLSKNGHFIVPVGIKKGEVFGSKILNLKEKPKIKEIHTVTMYIGPKNQEEWEEYILSLNPKRIIFNPGSETPSFASKAENQGIEVLNACTLVMLASDQY